MVSWFSRLSVPWLMTAICAGCPHQVRIQDKPKTEKKEMVVVTPRTPPRIRNISESEPIISLTYLAGYIYAASPTQIFRHDVRNGKYVRITRRQGLPAGQLLAVSAHKNTGLWVATQQGIFQHNASKWRGHGRGLPKTSVLVLAATSRGVWAGGTGGLAILRDNKWSTHLEGTTVTHLLTRGPEIWIGTAGGGIYQHHQGKLRRHGPKHGQRLRHIRSLTLVGELGVMAAGREGGKEQISYFDGERWSTYTIKPKGRVHWVQQMDDGVLLAHDRRLLLLRVGADPGNNPPVVLEGEKARDAPWRYKVPTLAAEVVRQWLPRNPGALASHQGHVMVGTTSLGVALLGGGKIKWFRAHDLLGTRERLRMACARGACYIPGTRGQAFREADNKLSRILVTRQPGAEVQGFTNDQWGGVVAIHTPPQGRSLVVSELSRAGRFVPVYEARIRVPAGSRLAVRLIRTDPTGRMWIGLWAVGARDKQAWGLVVMRPPPSHAAVTWTQGKAGASPGGTVNGAPTSTSIPVEQPSFFHRSTLLPGEVRPPRSLAVPDDVRDAYFEQGKIWLATGDGVCLIRGTEVGTEVKLTTENEGIRSELIYGFGRAPGSKSLLVASFAGVGRQQGRRWVFDLERPLRTATHKLLVRGDVMWAGTTQGLARIRGRRALVIDRTLGLAHDAVLDLYLDEIGERMWVLTDGGLSILSLRGL